MMFSHTYGLEHYISTEKIYLANASTKAHRQRFMHYNLKAATCENIHGTLRKQENGRAVLWASLTAHNMLCRPWLWKCLDCFYCPTTCVWLPQMNITQQPIGLGNIWHWRMYINSGPRLLNGLGRLMLLDEELWAARRLGVYYSSAYLMWTSYKRRNLNLVLHSEIYISTSWPVWV